MRADLEFFAPEHAPKELLDACAAAWPGRLVAWLARVAAGSHAGACVSLALPDLPLCQGADVRQLKLGTGEALTVGLARGRR